MNRFRIELSDRNFTLLEVLDNEAIDISWAYSRIGGCGDFSFTLPRKLYEEKSISGDFNIKIYKKNDNTGSYDLWYQGLIEDKSPSLRGNVDTISISGHGYFTQLSRIYLDGVTYTGQEVSDIVKNILDTYIVPYTNITYASADIEVTTFTPDSIEFNTDAKNAMQTLADIVGTREWGVDKDRKFFFKARSETVGLRYPLGGKLLNFSEDIDFKNIINRVIIQGAEAGGTYYKATYNDTQSQNKYNLRTTVYQNSSISTATVSSQVSDSIFAEYSLPTRNSSFDLANITAQLEATIPIDLLTILAKEFTYGEKKFGTGLYSGEVNRRINRITYRLRNNCLNASVSLGSQIPSIAEEIAQVEYKLEQQRTASL